MRTEKLIDALAADAGTPPAKLGRAFWTGVAAAVALCAALFFILLGPREDFSRAMTTMRFDFKFVATIAWGAAAAWLALRLARPGDDAGGAWKALLVAPALLAVAVALELAAMPRETWMPRLIGRHALVCLTYVPILSSLPLVAVLAAMRRGAPSSPARAGAVAGLLAGAVGATFYAAQCSDDSPLFVAVWYPLAIAIVMAVGAAAGSRVLRW